MQQLETTVAEWRANEPSADLALRIGTAVEEANVPQVPSFMPGRRIFSLAFAALCVLAFVMFEMGKTSPADAMQRMVNAFSQIRNAHVVTWAVPDTGAVGNLEKVEEMWYQDGHWRKEGRWGSRLIIAGSRPGSQVMGTYYRYDVHAHKVVEMQETGAQWSTFTIASLTSMNTYPGAYRVYAESTDPVGGHTAQVLIVEMKGQEQGHRYRCTVDGATSLPVQIESQNRSGSEWQTTIRYVFDFNENLPASLFDPQDLRHENWSLTRP
jgi:hypothetical protein